MGEVVIPEVRKVKVEDIKTDGLNPNRMSFEQEQALKANILKFGFLTPIITNEAFVVADGEHRLQAAKELGMQEVPVIALPVKEVDRKILRQVMNKLRGEHDKGLDLEEFKYIALNSGLDDLKLLLGDDDMHLVQFLATSSVGENQEKDFDVESALVKPKYEVRVGDKWQLGRHVLLCGDATVKADVEKLLGGGRVNMVWTDPPYNEAYDQDNSPYGTPENSKGTILNDSMNPEAFRTFLKSSLSNMFDFNDGVFYVCMSCKEWATIMDLFQELGGHWSSTIIWNKNSFVLGRSDYHRKFEPILYGWKEGQKHEYFGGRTESDVWDINKPTQNDLHPTMKPIELISRALINSCPIQGSVLDLFGGSGSTLIACEQANRTCYMMELDPKYCSVIIERWEKLTGETPKKMEEITNN